MENLGALAAKYLELTVDYLTQTEVWVQLAIIAIMFLPALLLSRRIEPWLEDRARKIKGMPGLLRIVIP